MRVLRLKLTRFGDFTDREVGEFSEGLTVVYGRNEAGKSTLAGALRFAMFGPDAKGYRTPGEGRAVEVRLERQGKEWTLKRGEKGRGAFSLNSDKGERVNREEFLRGWLDGISPRGYEAVYTLGLDELGWHAELRDLLMLADSGHAGTLLREAIVETKEAADELFAPTAIKRPLNIAVDALKRAGEEVRKLSRRPEELNAIRQKLADKNGQVKAVNTAIEELRVVRERHRALVDARPRWEEFRELERAVKALSDLEDFPRDARQVYEQATQRLDRAKGASDAAQQAVEHCKALLKSRDPVLPTPPAILASASTASDTVLQQFELITRTVREERAAREEARGFTAKQFGAEARMEHIAKLDVSTAAVAELDKLGRALALAVARRDELSQEVERAVREEEASRTAYEKAEAHSAGLPKPQDMDPWRERRRRANRWTALVHQLTISHQGLERAEGVERDLQDRQKRVEDARRRAQPKERFRTMRSLAIVAVILALGGVGLFVYGQWIAGAALMAAAAAVITVGIVQTAPRAGEEPVTEAETAAAVAGIDKAEREMAALIQERQEQADFLGLETSAAEAELNAIIDECDKKIREEQEAAILRARAAADAETEKRHVEGAGQRLKAARELLAAAEKQVAGDEKAWRSWIEAKGLPTDLDASAARSQLEDAKVVQQHLGAADAARKRAEEAVEDLERMGERHTADLAEAGDECVKALKRARASNDKELSEREAKFTELEGLKERMRQAGTAVRGPLDEARWKEFRGRLERVEAGAGWQELEKMAQQSSESIAVREGERDALLQEIGRLKDEGERMETEPALAEALLNREAAAAQVRMLAREWRSQAVAHALLAQARKRFERQRQPETVKRTGELMGKATGGRWSYVLAREGALVMVKEGGDDEDEREAETLSRSTRESLFLCARMAAIEHAVARSPLPVVLDDALVNLDAERLDQMLPVVGLLARRTQVILLTCHSHIVTAVKKLGITHSLLELPDPA